MWLLGLASLPVLAQVSRGTPAKKTAIDGPGFLALDKEDHLFVAEIYGNVVRRVDLLTKTMSTWPETASLVVTEKAEGDRNKLEFPMALALDSSQ